MADKVISDKLWKIIGEKGWIGFALLGLALTAIGGTGKTPGIGEITDPTRKDVLLYFGLGLIVFAAIAYWFSRQHEAEPTGPNVRTPLISKDLNRNKKTYGIRITLPKMSKKVTNVVPPVIFEGTLQKVPPPGTQIWLFNEGYARGGMTYWPQEFLHLTGLNWTVTYRPGMFDEGETRALRFYLAGNDGEALISSFKKINSHHITQHPGRWEGITKLTNDIGKLTDVIRIRLVSKADQKVTTLTGLR